MKNTSLGNLCLSFAITRSKIEKKCEKTTLKLHKTAYPDLMDPRGTYLMFQNQSTSRTYQASFAE